MTCWRRMISFLFFLALSVQLTGCLDSTHEPFGHTYQVTAISEISDNAEADKKLIVKVDVFGNLLIADDMKTMEFSRFGEFKKSKQHKNTWIIGEDDTDIQYILRWDGDNGLMLSMMSDAQLQWTYTLEPVDTVSVNVSSGAERSSLEIDWYYADTFSGDLLQLSKATVHGEGKMGIQVAENVEQIVVYEEYCTDGIWESYEYTLNYETGFSLNLVTRYPSGNQYAIYRIPYANGEYIFYLEYLP